VRRALLLALVAAACGGGSPPAVKTSKEAPKAAPAEPVAPPPAAEPSVEKRVVISLSRNSGTYVTTTSADGRTIEVALDVLENGRGPRVDATYTFVDGTMTAFEATGKHTMGTKVAESFARAVERDARQERVGDRVRWHSLEESGERDAPSRAAFYVPMASEPGVVGMIVRAALREGGTLPLLPGGEARVEKVGELTVRGGAASEPRTLVGYAIHGLDLTPTYTWMNPDGRWFGSASAWFSVVPEGWEAAIEPLIARQTELLRDRDVQLAERHARRPPAAGLVYTHARVLDVRRGKWLADQAVVVVGDAIAWTGATAAAKLPEGAEVVDLAGKAILPGLIDMHAHLGDADGVLNIASGVTSVRDVGNDPDKLDDYKQRYDEGRAIGPHVARYGFIEGRNEKAASSKVTAETEQEARDAVALFAGRGYDGIKIYNSVKPELVPLLAAEAHARGLRVTGHIPVHMLANEAVRAGYDGIEHINMLFLNFFATRETDTRDTTRFTLVGDRAATFDLGSPEVKAFVELLRDRKTVVDPTVGVFEGLLVGEQGKIPAGLEGVVARLPVQPRRQFLLGGLPLDGKQDLYRASFEKLLEMIAALARAKVPLVIGTDALAGLMLHHEMALFVRAGLSPAEVLRMATLDAARALGWDDRTGTIERGKRADLFVVEGDPLVDIRDAARVVSTMRAGVVFASAPLYEAVGVRPYEAVAAD
jgi:hypothetical protein